MPITKGADEAVDTRDLTVFVPGRARAEAWQESSSRATESEEEEDEKHGGGRVKVGSG